MIKRGTIREDGNIFWCYNRGVEYWVTPEKFKSNQERNSKWAKENPEKNRANAKKWNRANREKFNKNKLRSAKNNPDSTKSSQLRIKFNITLEQYNELFYSQNRKCAICEDECKTGRKLAVDHDHKTGKIRGLLCMNCNNALGKFKDSTDLLTSAISYLLKKGC
jgi:hypothetical protein